MQETNALHKSEKLHNKGNKIIQQVVDSFLDHVRAVNMKILIAIKKLWESKNHQQKIPKNCQLFWITRQHILAQ